MKGDRAEVLDMKLLDNGDLRVKLAGREDRDRYIEVTRAMSAPGTEFEIMSDTEVVCKLPRPEQGRVN